MAQAQFVQHGCEQLPIFRCLDAFGLCAQNWYACILQSTRQVQRRLTSELDEHALGFLLVADVEHVFEGERLEVELVTSVVIGGNRLRIRVDHDCLKSELPQSKGRVHAAVIEFNSLPNSIWSATQDDDFAPGAIATLVLIAVGRVVVRCVSFKLGRARVDQPIGRHDARRLPFRADFTRVDSVGHRQLSI